MTAAAYLVLLERWIAAWVQDRLGPNRVGPLGLLQPLADGLKFIFKEEYTPAHVDKFLFILAPITILAAALAIFAVIPFGSVLPPLGLQEFGIKDPIRLIVAPGVDVGLVYVFALSSVAVYGVILVRLGQQQQIQLPGWTALECPAHRLRDSARAGHFGSHSLQRIARS